MKLLIQPEHGAGSLIKEIDGAKKTIEIAIFRFDHVDIERALERAVDRGVSVTTRISMSNRAAVSGWSLTIPKRWRKPPGCSTPTSAASPTSPNSRVSS